MIVSALCVPTLFSCKTTEENYRAAYEKTVEGRRRQAALDSTIYGADRRKMSEATIRTAGGDVSVMRQRVRVTDGAGATPENLHRYNVVVGQFKQLFNAKSLRERLADSGYPAAFVIETAEPFYYIVVESFDDVNEASRAMNAFKAKSPIVVKEPLPFILEAVGRHRAPSR